MLRKTNTSSAICCSLQDVFGHEEKCRGKILEEAVMAENWQKWKGVIIENNIRKNDPFGVV